MRLARLILPLLLICGIHADAAQGWRAIDGDTIVSPAGERIRIANIDTAEMECRCAYECKMAQAAKAATQSALERASRITLGAYERARDRHGRTLAYVIVDGRDLGELLMTQGLARPWTGKRRPWC